MLCYVFLVIFKIILVIIDFVNLDREINKLIDLKLSPLTIGWVFINISLIEKYYPYKVNEFLIYHCVNFYHSNYIEITLPSEGGGGHRRRKARGFKTREVFFYYYYFLFFIYFYIGVPHVHIVYGHLQNKIKRVFEIHSFYSFFYIF